MRNELRALFTGYICYLTLYMLSFTPARQLNFKGVLQEIIFFLLRLTAWSAHGASVF